MYLYKLTEGKYVIMMPTNFESILTLKNSYIGELFSLAITVEALWAYIGQNCAVWQGVGHFERKF